MKQVLSFLFWWMFPLWLIAVFCQSLLPAEVSGAQSGWILSLLQAILPLPITMKMVRKGAHLLEFFVLGVLAAGLCRRSGAPRRLWLLVAAVAGMAVGLCDETLQLFSAGRSGNVADVWLDCLGSMCGGGWGCIAARKNRKKAETG